MPQKLRSGDTILHLPPPTTSSSSPSSISDLSLDGLLYVQKLAKERGQVFDIESFLTPALKEEWELRKHPPVSRKRSASRDSHHPGSVPPRKRSRSRGGRSVSPITGVTGGAPPAEGVETGSAAVPGTDGQVKEEPPSITDHVLLKDPLSTEAVITSTKLEPEPIAAAVVAEVPPLPSPAIPKKPRPVLLHMHWKRREKILAQWDAEQAMEAAGIPVVGETVDDILRKEGYISAPIHTRRGEKITEKDKEGIMGSASYW